MYLVTGQNAKDLGGSYDLDNHCNSARAVAPWTSRRYRGEPRSHTARGVRDRPGVQSAERSPRQYVGSCALQPGRARGGPDLGGRYQCPTNLDCSQKFCVGLSIDAIE